ncbi:hypothetical protein KM043_009070 [Ampulex compressa]|nr:hypothetical protein KM043_009070 [Ampulex compressa]
MSSTRISVRRINAALILACLIGLVLCYYAYTVEIAKEKDDSYVALCDINEYISCTKPFTSKYGKGFGLIPSDSVFYLNNPIYGFGFYTIIAILSLSNTYYASIIVVGLNIVSNMGSVYLAYILYSINTLCIVCISTYVINALILFLSIRKLKTLAKMKFVIKKVK